MLFCFSFFFFSKNPLIQLRIKGLKVLPPGIKPTPFIIEY